MRYGNRSTAEWQAADQAHHIHSFTDSKLMAVKGTRVITEAKGVYLWDSDGNKLLDGMGGLWCVNVGYGRQELVDAASRQMETLAFYNNHFQTATPQMIELAETLAEITPGDLNHILFTNSGSEANDTIVRIARYYWQLQGKPEKQIFIGRNLAYHGSTLAGASLGGMTHMHAMGHSLLPGFAHIIHPNWYLLGGDETADEFGLRAARALEEKIIELGADNVAAFIGEPIQGAGGVINPPATYWPEIQRICRKYDILLVADEVICGFGRTGHWFGSNLYDIKPDMIPMAKGLSSGYLPIAAVAINGRVWDTVGNGGLIAHGFTYAGHPVSAAVAIANIGIIKREGLVDYVRGDIGPYFHGQLNALMLKSPIVGEVRGVGLMAALQLVRDKDSRELFKPEENAAILARDFAADNGLIMRAVGQSLVLSPPLVISRGEVDELIGKARLTLDYAARKLGVM